MADQPRGPLTVGRRDPPIQRTTLPVGPSLLTTVLATPGTIALPIGAENSFPASQYQSAPRNNINASTTRGTALTLLAPPQAPFKTLASIPVGMLSVMANTSQSAFLTLQAASSTVSATPGAFTWVGTTSSVPTQVNSSAGSYSWAGSTSSLSAMVVASPGSYTWAATTANIPTQVSGGIGSYSWTGTNSDVPTQVLGAVGAWSWTGSTSVITIPPTLVGASAGAYSWAGTQSDVPQQVSASIGAYAWTGTTSQLAGLVTVTASPGAWSWLGSTAIVLNYVQDFSGAGYDYRWTRKEKKQVRLQVIDSLSGPAVVSKEVQKVVRKYITVPPGIKLKREVVAPAEEFRASEIDWTALAKDWQEVQKVIVKAKQKQRAADEEAVLLLM